MSADGNNKWGGDATVLTGGGEAGVGHAGQDAEAAPAAPTEAPPAPVRAPGRWSRSPNVVDRPTLLGVMVLPAEGAAVVLTGLAADVWRALARPTAGDQLAERLGAGPTGTGSGPSPADVADTLRDLRALGAVREMR